MLVRERKRSGARAHAELEIEGAQLALDGVLTEEARIGHLANGAPGSELAEDLALAGGEGDDVDGFGEDLGKVRCGGVEALCQAVCRRELPQLGPRRTGQAESRARRGGARESVGQRAGRRLVFAQPGLPTAFSACSCV